LIKQRTINSSMKHIDLCLIYFKCGTSLIPILLDPGFGI